MTRYKLAFLPSARKEWDNLGANLREQFKTKLAQRLDAPHVSADRLRTLADCYKIKLRAAGYRLVYRVDDATITVVVVAVGQRDKSRVYQRAADRV